MNSLLIISKLAGLYVSILQLVELTDGRTLLICIHEPEAFASPDCMGLVFFFRLMVSNDAQTNSMHELG